MARPAACDGATGRLKARRCRRAPRRAPRHPARSRCWAGWASSGSHLAPVVRLDQPADQINAAPACAPARRCWRGPKLSAQRRSVRAPTAGHHRDPVGARQLQAVHGRELAEAFIDNHRAQVYNPTAGASTSSGFGCRRGGSEGFSCVISRLSARGRGSRQPPAGRIRDAELTHNGPPPTRQRPDSDP